VHSNVLQPAWPCWHARHGVAAWGPLTLQQVVPELAKGTIRLEDDAASVEEVGAAAGDAVAVQQQQVLVGARLVEGVLVAEWLLQQKTTASAPSST